MNHAIDSKACSIGIYDGQIPSFAGDALDRLYGALYASLPQLSLGSIDGVSTYACSAHGNLRSLFLFVREGRSLRVINEGMAIDADDAQKFAQQMFGRDPRIRKIRFHAIRMNGRILNRPHLQMPVTEDIVLDLPADEASYVGSLGKSTRKTLRQNLSRAVDLEHAIHDGASCDAALVDAIIGFNHARMARKQRSSAIDVHAASQLLSLVRARGIVGTVSIGGMLRAGTLACRFGDDVYSLVNAHDPEVDHLGMGNLSRHLMILAAIRAGARRFHLLGGHYASKRSCGARRLALDEVVIYRNRIAMLVDAGGICSMLLRSGRERFRVAIENQACVTSGIPIARDAAQTARKLRELAKAALGQTSAQH